MRVIQLTAFDLAMRFIGTAEAVGAASNPAVLAMLKLDQDWPEDDDVPWCSAFTNYVCWLLRLPRSKDLRARSWLGVGRPVLEPGVGFDVVILRRRSNSPGAHVIDAPGHVGFFAGIEHDRVQVLGGNQSDAVSVSSYRASRVLGYRRLYE